MFVCYKKADTEASGGAAFAVGSSAVASGGNATAMGLLTSASGRSAVAAGTATDAATGESVSIGECNSANTSADGTLLAAGNGSWSVLSGCESRSDAMVLKKSGELTAADSIESESGGFILPDGTVLEEAGDLEGLPTNGSGAFDLSNEDGLVASGTEGSGSIPTTGAGTRLMWYPAEAAFRAGRVGVSSGKGDVWDADNVGSGSAAFGVDTEASGDAATAMGFRTAASGDLATAMGQLTTASGGIATAMGTGTIAATAQSLSIGVCNSANTSDDGTLLAAGNGVFDVATRSCDSQFDALVLDDGGNLTISGSLTENSDRRLKTRVEPIGGNTLKKLSRLRPVRFEFKNQKTHPSGEQVGLIAQDVRKEFPSLVSKGSGSYLSLSYSKLTAVLLKGIQEQLGQIDRQQSTVNRQQAQIDSLEDRVQRLENQQREIDQLKVRLAALEAERSPSMVAGLTGSGTGLLFAFLVGGFVGAAFFWRRR